MLFAKWTVTNCLQTWQNLISMGTLIGAHYYSVVGIAINTHTHTYTHIYIYICMYYVSMYMYICRMKVCICIYVEWKYV